MIGIARYNEVAPWHNLVWISATQRLWGCNQLDEPTEDRVFSLRDAPIHLMLNPRASLSMKRGCV